MGLIPVFMTIFVCLFSFSAFAAKKTACTITINSAEEREVLRKRLPPAEWDLVEILPKEKKGADDSDDDEDSIPAWLNESCDKGLQCDILLISGHFGGNFFGNSGYELSLEQLERAACRPECAGIMKKPREVFLMGCNTLAGKDKDRRTPEEYLRVLLADGMDRSRAEQTVALRYSPWGNANFKRMSAVFSNTPKIYGFSSVGPLGRTSGPRLERYFDAVRGPYSDYLTKLTTQSPPNKSLREAFTSTTIAEAVGAPGKSSSAICYLENKNVVHLNKVRFVESALGSANPLEHAPAIASWVKTVKDKSWSDEEAEMWDRITWNKGLREQFVGLAENIRHLPSIEINLWRFAMHMRWITSVEFDQKKERAVLPFFNDKKITLGERDALCTLLDDDEKVLLDYRRLGVSGIDAHMAAGLACLGVADRATAAAAETAVLSSNKSLRESGIMGLYLMSERAKFDDFNAHLLARAFDVEKDESLGAALGILLGRLRGVEESFWLNKARAVVESKDKVEKKLIYLFAMAKDVPDSALAVLVEKMMSAKTVDELIKAESVPVTSYGIFAVLIKHDDFTPNRIAGLLLKHENSSVFDTVIALIGTLDEMPKEKKIAIVQALREKTQSDKTRAQMEAFYLEWKKDQ